MRILRWKLKLLEYDYDVVYKTGKTNVNADALLRNPIGLLSEGCKIINTKIEPHRPGRCRNHPTFTGGRHTKIGRRRLLQYVLTKRLIIETFPTSIIAFTPEELIKLSTT